jgi:signal transduction histidine kinase
VFDNLLSNAIKYSPSGGEITVEIERQLEPDAAWAVVRVRDEGLGIPSADQSRIFERFQRGGNVTGHIVGTGIGLAGSRGILRQHGGTIAVESREGEGSTFTVRLPLPASARRLVSVA